MNSNQVKYLSPESPSATPDEVERMLRGERIPMHNHEHGQRCPRAGCWFNTAPCELLPGQVQETLF